MSNPHSAYIIRCLELIEEKLQWGSAHGWKQRDFEQLSDLIFEKTGTRLSLSTLKRIWTGTFSSAPQPATLNALALFIGFESWNHFRASVGNGEKKVDNVKSRKSWSRKKIITLIALPLIVGVVTVVVFTLGFRAGDNSDENKVPFTHKILSSGVPNTVVFSFNLDSISASRFYFQQTWNDKTRVSIPSRSNNYTSIYYYPGYHTAKLFAGNKKIAEEKVLIKTKGWEAMAYADTPLKMPAYLSDSINDGLLYIPVEAIERKKGGITKGEFCVRFYNIGTFDSISADDFELTARLRNDIEHGGLTCQDVRFFIFGEQKMMVIPFSSPGCVGNLNLSVSDTYIAGQNNDLSALGINLSEWQNISLTGHQNTLSIVTNKTSLKASYKKAMGKLMGIMIEFKGSGALDSVVLKSKAGDPVHRWEF